MKEYKDERVLVLSIRSNRWNDRSISKKKANDENAYGYSTFVFFLIFFQICTDFLYATYYSFDTLHSLIAILFSTPRYFSPRTSFATWLKQILLKVASSR